MERVAIIGSPGAGKSTLARRLGARTGLPLVHLDAEYWQAGWVETDKAKWLTRVGELIAAPRWIIDGNYGGTMSVRLARSDTVVVLDYPTRLCLWRAFKRIVRLRGKVRPDMAEGCPERFDLEFIRYIATFRRQVRPTIEERLRTFGGAIVRLTTPTATDQWLAGLQN